MKFMGMFKNVKHWLHGLLAALIGGGAGAVSAAVGPMFIDPTKFNLSDGIGNVLKTMATSFVVMGVLNAMSYLKQSPLPPEGNGNGHTEFLKKTDTKP